MSIDQDKISTIFQRPDGSKDMVSYSRSQRSLHVLRTSVEENTDLASCTPFAIGSSVSNNIDKKSVARSIEAPVVTVSHTAAASASEDAVAPNSPEATAT